MENLKQVLDNLTLHDMHVHEINHDNGYKEFLGVKLVTKHWNEGVPLSWLVSCTHYIMKGADIVHIGNTHTIEGFALGLK